MADSEEIKETEEISQSGQSYNKADTGKRLIAGFIDVVLAIGCAAILGLKILGIGGLIGAAYMLFRDGLNLDFMDNRSIGKKIMKLRPVTINTENIDLLTSVRRNWMLALIPLSVSLIGIIFFGTIAFIICAVEVVLILTDDEGRRWGDKLADTKVIEVED